MGFVSRPAFTIAGIGPCPGTPVRCTAPVTALPELIGGGAAALATFAAAETSCREAGMKFLTIKTLVASNPDPFYAKTRAFYEAVDFLQLEILGFPLRQVVAAARVVLLVRVIAGAAALLLFVSLLL